MGSIRVGLLAVALVLPSCQSVLGIEELPGRTVTLESAECGPCVSKDCPAVRDACLADRGCKEVYSCVAECGRDNLACRGDCERKFALAAAGEPFRALDGCRRVNCTDECYGIGGFGGAVDPSCACTDAVCESFIRSCIRSGELRGERIGDCERVFGCFGTRARPLDPDDAVTCMFDPRWGGQVEANVVRFCWQGAVCDSCPLAGGRMNARLGQYKWSGPISDQPVEFDLTVTDQRGKGVREAKVSACLTPDCAECSMPVASGKTDANGTASLKLSTFGLGFRGCFQIEAAGKMPTLWYLGRPISRGESLMRVPIFSADELATIVTPLGLKLDPTRGQVVVATRDCIFSAATGLTLDPLIAPDAFVAYLRNGAPSRVGTTDDTGRAAIINAPPGRIDIVLRSGDTEFSRSDVLARAGFLTGVYALPNTTP